MTGHVETRVLHAERIQQPLLLELIERFSGDHLDHPTEDIDRMAVVPGRARLVGERQFGEAFGEIGIVDVTGKQASVDIGLLDQSLAEETVGEAGGVAHQVLDGDRALDRDRIQSHRPVLALLLDADLDVRERRNVFRQRLLQLQFAFLHQHHRGNRGDRFRHRIDAEDGVGRHRLLGAGIANAETIEVGRLAVALDHHDGTGNLVPGDLVLDVGIDASEPCARKTRFLGLGGEGAFGERARDGNEQHCDGSNAAQADG